MITIKLAEIVANRKTKPEETDSKPQDRLYVYVSYMKSDDTYEVFRVPEARGDTFSLKGESDKIRDVFSLEIPLVQSERVHIIVALLDEDAEMSNEIISSINASHRVIMASSPDDATMQGASNTWQQWTVSAYDSLKNLIWEKKEEKKNEDDLIGMLDIFMRFREEDQLFVNGDGIKNTYEYTIHPDNSIIAKMNGSESDYQCTFYVKES